MAKQERQPSNGGTPDRKIPAATYQEFVGVADQLDREGFRFDRNVPANEMESHIASFHRDPQVGQVVETPAFTRPDTTKEETEGKLLPDFVGIWYTTKG